MAWHWIGDPPLPKEFEQSWSSQGDAETWLGEFYPELRTAGVRVVSLYDGDRRVYGPMPLDPDA